MREIRELARALGLDVFHNEWRYIVIADYISMECKMFYEDPQGYQDALEWMNKKRGERAR